jgi:hypothetical protein
MEQLITIKHRVETFERLLNTAARLSMLDIIWYRMKRKALTPLDNMTDRVSP